jgi:glycosyltransferase involved in cell wall biosynthesis
MSTVSVIVPCYNYAHFLRNCVESVLSQIDVEVRVLVIDDASPDSTPAVAEELLTQEPRVEYRRHASNQGHISTYNEGLAWADGDYTVLISADDLLTPGSLKRATALMEAHPEVGLVYGGCVRFYTSNPAENLRLPKCSNHWKIYDGPDWLELILATDHGITSPEVVVRTCLQHELGGYLPGLPTTGDLEMWMRFAVHAAVGHILDADQACYRLHERNMHSGLKSTPYRFFQQRKAAYDSVFQNYRGLIPRRQYLRKLADRSLARDALWTLLKTCYYGKLANTPIMELFSQIQRGYGGSYLGLGYISLCTFLIQRLLLAVRNQRGASAHSA